MLLWRALSSERKEVFKFCFDILEDNKIEQQINAGFYVTIIFRGAKFDKIPKKHFLAPFWKYDVIIIFFTLSMTKQRNKGNAKTQIK